MKGHLLQQTVLRSVFTCFILTFSLLAFLSISPKFATSFSRALDENLLLGSIVGILGFLTAVGTFYLWGYMIYHWANASFTNSKTKGLCFLLITLGMFVGAVVYYIVVYEKRLFLRREQTASS
jgi:hypothetical protein